MQLLSLPKSEIEKPKSQKVRGQWWEVMPPKIEKKLKKNMKKYIKKTTQRKKKLAWNCQGVDWCEEWEESWRLRENVKAHHQLPVVCLRSCCPA